MNIEEFNIEERNKLSQASDARLKLDSLRLENQQLRIEIEVLRTELNLFLSLRYLIHRTIKTFFQSANNKKRQIIKNIVHGKYSQKIKNIINNSENVCNLENTEPSANFSPYQVKAIQSFQDNRPRILHVIGNFYTGGSSQLVVDLIEHLSHRFEQEVIVRDLPATPRYVGLSIHHHEKVTHYCQVLSILKNFKPDLIHIHYLGHHQDDYSELDWQWYHKIFQAAEKYGCKIIENINIPTDPYVSELVNYYVYVSNYVCHEFGYLKDRNITIYPGSDLTLFSRKNASELPQDCIGMVYRLEGDKLNEEAIDVFIKTIQKRPKTKALIIGGGRYLELYQKKVRQAGVSEAFTFTGYTSYESLPKLYEQIGIFIAPVHTESFGQVTPFAMGMGIPVVGYNVGAIPEIIEDCELLAPAGDSDTLANIIVDLLEDRQRQLKIGAMNRQRAQQRFSVEAMIEGYSKLYDETIKTLEVEVDA